MAKHTNKKISNILIISGIVLIIIPLIGYAVNSHKQKELMLDWGKNMEINSSLAEAEVKDLTVKQYLSISNVFINSYSEETEGTSDLYSVFEVDNITDIKSDITDQSQISEATNKLNTVTSTEEKNNKNYEPIIIGKICIEKINKELLIIEGITADDLRYGAGHIPGTADIGNTGNCAIAGHRNYTFGKYFNRLNELEIGDRIHLSNKCTSYIYTVYKKTIVEPSDISILKNEGDKKILTLITCEPPVIASHRLIIQAIIE